MTVATAFKVEPLEATFGAVVTGLKLAQLDDAAFAQLYETWLEYALLVFPAQYLTNDEQVTFAKRFGELEFDLAPISNVRSNGSVRVDDDSDDVLKVLKGNMGWHCDSTYMPVQAKGAVFTAHLVPATGGETGWADMRAGFRALDADTQARLTKLSAYHSLYYSQSKMGHAPKDGSDYSGYGFHDQDPPLRPLVKAHPETGRSSLVIGRHAYGIPGMDPDESERLLGELVETACQAPRTYHHTWSEGDAVVWDNRCLLHRACPWDMKEPRVMYHARIAGDPATEFAAHG
jgi:alpha-ketoglutarate-dependent taurine dioxygenase